MAGALPHRRQPLHGDRHQRPWNSFTGNSDGWRQVAFDLSAYAGKQVEISIAYVSDPFTGGTGLFIDDTRLTTTGGTVDAEGFETGLGPWTIQGAPEGSPGNRRSSSARRRSSTWSRRSTEDSVLLGFGLEQTGSAAEREQLLDRALARLIG